MEEGEGGGGGWSWAAGVGLGGWLSRRVSGCQPGWQGNKEGGRGDGMRGVDFGRGLGLGRRSPLLELAWWFIMQADGNSERRHMSRLLGRRGGGLMRLSLGGMAVGLVLMMLQGCAPGTGERKGAAEHVEMFDFSSPAGVRQRYLGAVVRAKDYPFHLTWRRPAQEGGMRAIGDVDYIWRGREAGFSADGFRAVLGYMEALPAGSTVVIYPAIPPMHLTPCGEGELYPFHMHWDELFAVVRDRQLRLVYANGIE